MHMRANAHMGVNVHGGLMYMGGLMYVGEFNAHFAPDIHEADCEQNHRRM